MTTLGTIETVVALQSIIKTTIELVHTKRSCGCKPRSFYDTEGAIGLSRLIEKMEAVFHIIFCPRDYQVKYTTCTLMNSALSCWNNHAKSIGLNEAYAMRWEPLKQMMIKEYYPRQEVQALEQELLKLIMQGLEVAAYTSDSMTLLTFSRGW